MPKETAHYFYYLLVLAIFLIITGPSLFSDGMFMDGLFYAAVSNNMAEGIGTFWKPYLAEFYYKEFFEHPPLALGIQSIWFRAFGDSIYVERFYALFCYLVTGYLISHIWKEITGETKTGWLPILLWITVAIVPWACANNMLENTMTVFVCLSVLFYLKYFKTPHLLFHIISAISLSLALVTKGLVCLYVWALPFFLWLIYRKKSFTQMFSDTVGLILMTLAPLLLLYFLHEPAAISFSRYIGDQLITSLDKIVTVSSRFHIVGEFLQNILVPIAIALLALAIHYFKERSFKIFRTDFRMSMVLLLLCLAGVLPIMISLKQRGFYILTVYPFFAIALALVILPIANYYLPRIPQLIVKRISVMLCIIAMIICGFQIGRVGRDADRIADCKKIIDEVGEEKIINIPPSSYADWSLHGYLARYGHISLDTLHLSQEYLYTQQNITLPKKDYSEVEINSKQYGLYRLKASLIKQ